MCYLVILVFLLPLRVLADEEVVVTKASGAQLTEQYCTACHGINRITDSMGYSHKDWQALTASMIDLNGNPNQASILDYLAKQFPPNTRRQPQLISGNAQIEFKEWVVPTLGQRSRDPVQAENGLIWWAGQWGNLVGSINPKTGAMKEYPLPANAMPHSVTLGPSGGVWYTGNKNGTVGKLNPETGDITVYPMPDQNAKDPHTAVFDDQGIMWFTLQHSNKIGRLNPKIGEIKLVDMPRSGSRPYGIKIDANGQPWVACNGNNCLVQVNPETMALTEHLLPDEATKVRRIDFSSDGMLWYVNSSLGRLGRFDPKTKHVKEWPSPSGPKSHPYAIVVVDDIIWYNESGMRPDALVRFDPQHETFQSWTIPSGSFYAGIIRHMRATKEGNILIHQSSTNRIIEVDIKRN